MSIEPDCSTQSPNRRVAYEPAPRVAGYIRVSTEDQAREGFSLDAQGTRLQRYCEAKGWSLVRIYRDETSGRATTRPAYRCMMADMDKWDILLVVKQDRIHRNVRNFYEMVDELRANGKQFASVEESIDTTTATGWASIGILAIWAQLESDQISERVRKAIPVARAKNCHLGRPPVGFTWVKATKTFKPTDWALAIEADVSTCGKAEAGRRHPYPEGKNRGKCVPERSVQRIVENLELDREGRLVPNGLSGERYGYKPLEVPA
ncbi:MAG TPA: recombinase family protein [Thermoplasmata archaeon]|nr:recombinase family protein [Thermoplasmata archaeon]